MTQPDRTSYVLLLFLAVIWGGSFLLIVISLRSFDSIAIVWVRVSLAALALAAGLLATGGKLPSGLNEWKWCGVLGLTGLAIPFNLVAWALNSVPSGVVAVLIAAIPLFTLALTRLVFGDAVSRARWIGFGVGLTGLIVLSGPEAVTQLGRGAQMPGQLACLLASLFFAFAAILVRAMPPMPPLTAVTGMHISAAVITLPLGIVHLPGQVPDTAPILALIILGVFQTGFAQFLRFTIIRRAGVVFTSTVGYLIPIWAGILGFIVLDERFTPTAIAAYMLIVTGLIVARPRKPAVVPTE